MESIIFWQLFSASWEFESNLKLAQHNLFDRTKYLLFHRYRSENNHSIHACDIASPDWSFAPDISCPSDVNNECHFRASLTRCVAIRKESIVSSMVSWIKLHKIGLFWTNIPCVVFSHILKNRCRADFCLIFWNF